MSASDVKFLLVEESAKMADVVEKLSDMKPSERPSDPVEFENLLAANGVSFSWPNGRPRAIVYNDMADDVLSVSLPSLNAIAAGSSIAGVANSGPYPLDEGYDVAYSAARKPSLDAAEWEHVYRTRLGDYTIGKCM